MRAGFGGPGTLLAVVLLIGVPAVQAQQIETRGGSCNDAPFGSDGGGITACMDYALRYDDMMAGIGIFGVTKDAKKAGKDPLEAKGRIMSWVGRQGDMGGDDYAVSGRIGIEGGTADSPIRELRKEVRDLKRVLAEKTLEVDFFKGALQKIEARRQGNNSSGGTASTPRFGK